MVEFASDNDLYVCNMIFRQKVVYICILYTDFLLSCCTILSFFFDPCENQMCGSVCVCVGFKGECQSVRQTPAYVASGIEFQCDVAMANTVYISLKGGGTMEEGM